MLGPIGRLTAAPAAALTSVKQRAPHFTGYTRDGGFATAAIADASLPFRSASLAVTWSSLLSFVPV